MIFIRLDENISYKIGEVADLIRIQQGIQFEAPHPNAETGLADQHWMEILGKRGKRSDLRIAFSGDYFNEAERATAEVNNITVFYAPRNYWRGLKRVGQAAFVLRWLPKMIELATSLPAGTQFQLPASFNPDVKVKLLDRILGKKVTRSGRPRKPKSLPLLDRN